jgi:hypothetical protein
MSDVETLSTVDPADIPAPPPYNPYEVLGGRNPKWGDPAHAMILVEVDFAGYGWIPFATPVANFPTDPNEAHCQIIAEAALAGDYGPIAEYAPPTLDYTRAEATPIGRVDFRNGMKAMGVTTAVVTEYLASIADPDHQEEMQIFWEDSQIFRRMDDFVTELGAYAGKTPEQLDPLWGITA